MDEVEDMQAFAKDKNKQFQDKLILLTLKLYHLKESQV